MGIRRWIVILLAIAVLGGLAIGLLIWKPWQTAELNRASRTVLTLSQPPEGAVVPLHSTVGVAGEGLSTPGFTRVELWVNDQLWAEREFPEPTTALQEFWSWTPSGEGQHKLLLRATDSQGRTVQSNRLTLIALQEADVRFPLPFEARGGESVAGLARAFETDPQAILDSNPGLNSSSPLAPGQQITIPVPVPNSPPAAPENGQPAAPPSQPLPDQPAPAGDSQPGDAQVNLAQIDLPLPPGFEIKNGLLIPKFPVDNLYLYASLAGSPWQRLPADPDAFLLPTSGVYDLAGLIPPEALAGLPRPTPFELEAWGWTGGQLVYLGREGGVLGENQTFLYPGYITATHLEIIGRIRDQVTYESEWTIPSPVEGYYQGYSQGFRWSSAAGNVAGGIWQISSKPFSAGLLWTPDVVASGKVPPPKVVMKDAGFPFPATEEKLVPSKFTVDFAKFIDIPEEDLPSKTLFELIQQAMQPQQIELHRVLDINSLLPTTFYVRVIPISKDKQLLEPSNTVVVRYGPPEQIPVNAQTGSLYDARAISFQPYLPADASYASCMLLTKPIQTCTETQPSSWDELMKGIIPGSEPFEPEVTCQTIWPAGSQSCGCPGVSCESSDSGCGWNVACHLANGAEALGGLASDFLTWVAKTYNDIKNSVVDFVGDIGCAGFSGDAKAACKTAINAGVNIGLASLGIPPELPEFDKLLEQGLEYAVQTAIAEVTGCDPLCQDAIRKGLELLAHPDKLIDEGLDYGLQLAQDELEKKGITCDDFCQGVVKDAVKGDLDAGKYLDQALTHAAQEAADYLNSEGIPCDQACEATIKQQLKAGADSFNIGPYGTAGNQPPNLWKPHPRALEQPAVLTVRVTRRVETAGIPAADIERCGLSIYNHATNTVGGTPVDGKLFEAIGLDIPAIEPGEIMDIPILLTRSPWNPPPGFTFSNSSPPGVIIGALSEIDVGQWSMLYYGSQATFNFSGPYFLTTSSEGQSIGLPCVSGDSYQTAMPLNP